MRRERGIRVFDNCCWQVIAPLQTRLCSDNVPVKTAVEKGGRSGMVMRKNDNYKSIVGCVIVNVLTRKRGTNCKPFNPLKHLAYIEPTLVYV